MAFKYTHILKEDFRFMPVQVGTIVEGIVQEYKGKISGFEFLPVPTPAGSEPTPTPITRRPVQITLIVDDKNNPMNEPLVSEKLLTPRSNSY